MAWYISFCDALRYGCTFTLITPKTGSASSSIIGSRGQRRFPKGKRQKIREDRRKKWHFFYKIKNAWDRTNKTFLKDINVYLMAKTESSASSTNYWFQGTWRGFPKRKSQRIREAEKKNSFLMAVSLRREGRGLGLHSTAIKKTFFCGFP